MRQELIAPGWRARPALSSIRALSARSSSKAILSPISSACCSPWTKARTRASRIAGLLAGARGLPITVLHVGARAKQREGKRQEKRQDEERHEAVIREAATAIAEADRESVGDVEVTTRAPVQGAADAVVEEARKGFDLLVVGMENVLGKDGFDKKIEDVASGFKGPVALVAAKGVHLKQPASAEFRILAPVSGSALSRRGAEIAGALKPSSTQRGSCVHDQEERRAPA
ncbi:hypothetical protein CQ10_29635 [Bradyrhizobium valentinum]|uniref:Uncharacterized protein n=1 Tax=Bradyrhizobium valentinum TaxID=1518501 RepID=A0A0R3KC31_9BRAD|nr:hypothetical protein CP49_33085 [Bradyrhizobium valentinum]KRQ97019.1 hypothetical protein CQ10_29635 [Bradyrhizobium valentinum]